MICEYHPYDICPYGKIHDFFFNANTQIPQILSTDFMTFVFLTRFFNLYDAHFNFFQIKRLLINVQISQLH